MLFKEKKKSLLVHFISPKSGLFLTQGNGKYFCAGVQDLLDIYIPKKEMYIFPTACLFNYLVLKVKLFYSFYKSI